METSVTKHHLCYLTSVLEYPCTIGAICRCHRCTVRLFIGIWTLPPALTVVGFSEQEVAATMGITVIVGVWAIAVALYFRYREPDATQ